MHETAAPLFADWEAFYVIVGSSGAALTGLQFVVITLVTELRRPSSADQIGAFATPSIVHFCAVLLLSAVLSAPWHGLRGAAFLLVATGVFGVIYTAIVTRRAQRQTGYQLVLEDWLFHTALPFVSYAALLGAGAVLPLHTVPALFTIAAMALLLLFIGIHNAWDTVTYVVVQGSERSEPPAEPKRKVGKRR
jgi:hypothetical protein